jgi:hypothetical protein
MKGKEVKRVVDEGKISQTSGIQQRGLSRDRKSLYDERLVALSKSL